MSYGRTGRLALCGGLLGCCAALWGGPALAQQQAAGKGFVSRKEYEALERRLRAVEQRTGGDEALAEMDQRVSDVEEKADAARPGWTHFLLTGYGTAGYRDVEGDPSSFSATFNPIFLWKIGERILAEAEVEFELEDDETHVGLEYAQLTYILNDWIVLGVGKFLNPANHFMERLHPAWINKLPDRPLPFTAGVIADAQLGVEARGAIAVADGMKVSYAFFVSNGPRLVSDDPARLGTLDDANFDDTNYSKEVGGRIALHPITALEIGYGLEWANAALDDASRPDADIWVQSLDVNYAREADLIYGQIDFRAQWIWTHVQRVTYDVAGANGFGPTRFDNRTQAGYVQISYRPSKLEGFVSGFEAVVRFDMIDRPTGAPTSFDEKRWTLGVNYWWWDSGVLKLAWRRADRNRGERDEDAVLVQVALGF